MYFTVEHLEGYGYFVSHYIYFSLIFRIIRNHCRGVMVIMGASNTADRLFEHRSNDDYA